MEKAHKACNRLVGKKWGLTPVMTQWIYTAIIRPILLYSVIVWWPVVEKKTYLSKLERIQRIASLGITGALKTTPSHSLDILLHLLPIDLFARYTTTKSLLRLKNSNLIRCYNYGHSSLRLDTTITTDYMLPQLNFNRKKGGHSRQIFLA